MRIGRHIAELLLVAGFSLSSSAGTLDIQPVTQDTPVWCWVAVGEMVFDHFSIPNVNPGGYYQCGIVGLLAAGTMRQDCAYQCQNCSVPAGSHTTLLMMLDRYPERVAYLTGDEMPRLQGSYASKALTRSRVIEAIDEERPIIAGVSFAPVAGVSQHVALIVGYDDDDEDLPLLVNDPFPFGSQNPYTEAGGESNGDGSYWIDYESFRRGLRWRESIVVREAGTIRPPRKGEACCFTGPYGPDSCPLNLSGPLPLGAPCQCNYPNVWFTGRVCD